MTGGKAFSWRPMEPGDAADWAALLAATEIADGGSGFFSERDLLEMFDDPYRDFARGSTAIYDGTTMVGCSVLAARSTADPVHEMRCHGRVHPRYRNRGLGGQLLDWAEEAAVQLHEDRHPGRRMSLSGSCRQDNASAVALYEKHGYHATRWMHLMAMDLSAPLSLTSVPAGVEIVGFTPDRSGDALLVRNEAFRDHWGSTVTTAEAWAHATEAEAFRSAFSSLAYAEGEPLGLVLAFEHDAYAEATGIRDLYIGIVGTRRAGRNRGIASAMLTRALAKGRDAGFTQSSLNVDADSLTGAVGLYERIGFTTEYTTVSQTKTLR
jgi:mycothiol synthase